MSNTDRGRSVRLWRHTPPSGVYFTEKRDKCGCVEYIARPRADDDARERRIRADESRAWINILREYAVLLGIDTTREGDEPGQVQILHAIQGVRRDRDEWKARATAAEAERDAYRDTAHAMMGAVFGEEPPWTDEKIDRMEASTVGEGDKKPSDTIRRIVRERDALLLLLDDIRDNATTDIPSSIMDRIDAALGDATNERGAPIEASAPQGTTTPGQPGTALPTTDDRKGEDGAWCERGEE